MRFEWDDEKEKINITKHGIDFSIASLVFNDYYRIEKYDELHSSDEDRYITIGEINGTAVVVMVVYTDRSDAIRIISARKATKTEKEEYYDNKKRN
ncbi:MAG: BrnT family toxin [Ruminococcus sp.]|nr:BrnT family toxin [Ruminococcus sp.]